MIIRALFVKGLVAPLPNIPENPVAKHPSSIRTTPTTTITGFSGSICTLHITEVRPYYGTPGPTRCNVTATTNGATTLRASASRESADTKPSLSELKE